MQISTKERDLLLRIAEHLPQIGSAIVDLVKYVNDLETAYAEEHEANIILYDEMRKMQEVEKRSRMIH